MTADLDISIGRTLMVGVRGAEAGDPDLERDLDACVAARVGGVVLFDRDLATGGARNVESPAQVGELVGYLRSRLGGSLIVGIDQEGGRVARLCPEHGFRRSLSAAAFVELDPERQKEEARAEATQLASLGIDLNFAPCVDLALGCPVIDGAERAYSADPARVIAAARAVLDAHKEAGVAGCLKHYPGHGSARDDSHLGLVDITDSYDTIELEPYRALAGEAACVMMAHVIDRRIDAGHPASLSEAHVSVLRHEIGFRGAIVTDSIDMDGVAVLFDPGGASVRSLSAGCDLVMHAFNRPGRADEHPAPGMARAIRESVEAGGLDPARVREAAGRVDRLSPRCKGGGTSGPSSSGCGPAPL